MTFFPSSYVIPSSFLSTSLASPSPSVLARPSNQTVRKTTQVRQNLVYCSSNRRSETNAERFKRRLENLEAKLNIWQSYPTLQGLLRERTKSKDLLEFIKEMQQDIKEVNDENSLKQRHVKSLLHVRHLCNDLRRQDLSYDSEMYDRTIKEMDEMICDICERITGQRPYQDPVLRKLAFRDVLPITQEILMRIRGWDETMSFIPKVLKDVQNTLLEIQKTLARLETEERQNSPEYTLLVDIKNTFMRIQEVSIKSKL